jgi:hypothetical protein
MSSGGPTPDQIRQVKLNLARMQKFNDFVSGTITNKVLHAYLLLSENDDNDPGLTVGLNIFEGLFWAIGSEFGQIGNFAASFLSGMVSWWASETPPSLKTTFASMLSRLQNTQLAVDTQLADYHSDVPKYWDTQFTFNGQTATLSDFAAVTFPPETDPVFEAMAAAAELALDQQIWATVMRANYVITFWETSGNNVTPGKRDDPPVHFDEEFIAAHPAYYNSWTWHNSSGCGDFNGWIINEYNIGTGYSAISDGSMGDDACHYLFIDSADNVVINPKGLFHRATVFNDLGIRQVTHRFIGGEAAPTLSKKYLRAMKEGKTLGILVQREGREAVERRVIERAQSDPVFAADLARRPREALEKFLGVAIPEVLSLTVVVETSRTFGLVVPMPKPPA